jgi:hypothetical protein
MEEIDTHVPIDILKSGIQKYIRRCMIEKALLCGSKIILYSMAKNKQRLWINLLDRLMIICGEDIGIGNLSIIYNILSKLFEIKKLKKVLSYKEKYVLVAPLICAMCICEKTREFAHIYYGVYEGDEYKPQLSLDECIDKCDIGLVYWFKHDPEKKIDILSALIKKAEFDENINFLKLTLLSNKISMTVNENEWFYGLILLIYCYKLDFSTESIEFEFDSKLYNFDGTELIEFDEFVLDKHTKAGRAIGRDLKYFVHTGAIVYPESKRTTYEYKKIHDEIHG